MHPWRLLLLVLALTAAAADAAAERVSIAYSVIEEQPEPRIVGNLVDDTQLAGQRWNETFRRGVEFRLIMSSLLPRKLLQVDPMGNLVLHPRLDREAICRGLPDCDDLLQFDARTPGSGLVAFINVQLTVLDANDNAPAFDEPVHVINVSEAASVGQTFQLPAARDADSPRFGVQPDGYQLEGGQRLLQPLDRERESRYSFVLRASDRGLPVNTGTVSVVVNVLDENDQTPVIVGGCSDVYKDEDATVGTVLTTIVARDGDIGANARLQYRIRSVVGARVGSKELPQATQDLLATTFHLDPDAGSLIIAKPLDYEMYSNATLSIVVSDTGKPPRSAECLMRVIVKDTNDNRPVVTFQGMRRDDVIEIEESQPPEKQPFAYMYVDDKDAGEAGRVTCVAVSPGLKLRGSKPYFLYTTTVLDHENVTTVTWLVSCRDNGSPPQVNEARFNVTVLDVNDNSPRFKWDYKSISMDEGKQAGELILDLRATDADAGENARISYSIDNSVARFFRILDNGTLVAATVLDRETQETYEFGVTATDHGIPALTARAQIRITLADINDCAPTFEKSTLEFSVPESAGVGQLVGRVRAIDMDSGSGGQVVYTPATEGNDAARAFRVDRDGNIRVERPLDREDQDKYFIRVLATDMGTPQLNGTGTVIIRIEDVNDNRPVVRWPNLINHTVTVSYLTRPRTTVCSIDAVDNDLGANAQLLYSIGASSGADLFDIHGSTGGVQVRRDLTKADIGRYELQVNIRDMGQPPLSAVAHLMLLVDDSQPATASGLSASEMNFLLIIVICSVTFVLSCILVASIWHTRRRLAPGNNNRLYAGGGKCCSAPEEADPVDSKTPMESHTMVDLPLESLDSRLKVSHASLYARSDCIMPLHHCHLHDYEAGLPGLAVGPTMPRPVQRGEASGQSSESDSGRGTCFIEDDPFREHGQHHQPHHATSGPVSHHHQQQQLPSTDYRSLTIGPRQHQQQHQHGPGPLLSTFTLDRESRQTRGGHHLPASARGGGGGFDV